MVSVFASSAIDCGYELRSCLEQKNIKLVFVASPLRTQHSGERTRLVGTWLGIRIMCPSGATYLPNDCC